MNLWQVIGSSTIVFSVLLIGGGLYLRRISSDMYVVTMIARRGGTAADCLGIARAEDCLQRGVGKWDKRPVFVMARQKLRRQRYSRVCLVLGALGVAAGAGLVFIQI